MHDTDSGAVVQKNNSSAPMRGFDGEAKAGAGQKSDYQKPFALRKVIPCSMLLTHGRP